MANGRVGNRRAIINLAEQADEIFKIFAGRITMLEARLAELERPWWERWKLRRQRARAAAAVKRGKAAAAKQTEGGA